jgi:hypothetical protein
MSTYTCSNCGSKFSGYGNICSMCRQTKELSEQQEKNRDQHRKLANEQEGALREATQNAQRLAQAQINAQLVIFAVNAKIEQERKNREEKLIQATLELRISDADVFNEGYNLEFINQFPNAFQGALDEFGKVTNLFYDHKYISENLKKAYNNGAWQRLSDDGVMAPCYEYIKSSAYNCGYERLGISGEFYIPRNINGVRTGFNYTISTRIYPKINGAFIIQNSSTGELFFQCDTLPFTNDDLNQSYLAGMKSYLSTQNTSELINHRIKEEQERQINAAAFAEKSRIENRNGNLFAVIILAAVAAGLWGVWYYFVGNWIIEKVVWIFSIINEYPKTVTFIGVLFLAWSGWIFLLGLLSWIYFWFIY